MTQKQVGIIVHGIGTPMRELEAGEAPYWISEAQFEHLLDLIAALPDPSRIRLSFDDGNLSDHDIALPALLARGLTAEFFVLTGRIGDPGALDVAHIQALQTAGMGIGSHGINHLDWRRAPQDILVEEVRQSRAVLQDICQGPIDSAAIPFGSYNAQVLKALKAAGYQRIYSSDRGEMTPTAFLCPRTSVQGAMTPLQFEALLSGQLPLKQALRRRVSMALRRLPYWR